MDFLRAWFLGVAGAAMAGVFALTLAPPGAAQKTVRIAAALLLAAAVLRPLAGWAALPAPDAEYGTFWAAPAGTAPAGEELLASIIEEKTAAYIVNKAQAVGLTVSVTARCRTGEGYPEPWAVTVRSERPEHAKSALSAMIESDLGIPPGRQTYAQSAVRQTEKRDGP
ncbi:MAG: hypothetical protein LBH95_02810 [Oscillospiraceae bacterium]|jgi:hypothetical protein|nr:hypothetical protein [Oscillospiraceae bacterium]